MGGGRLARRGIASTLLASLNAQSSNCEKVGKRAELSNEIVLMIAIMVMTAENYCPSQDS